MTEHHPIAGEIRGNLIFDGDKWIPIPQFLTAEELRAEVERLQDEVALACALRDQHITKSNALHNQNERLRAEHKRLTARLKEAMNDLQDGAIIIVALRAENKRLRAELDLVSK